MIVNDGKKSWEARYTVEGTGDVRVLEIESRSAITVCVAKIIREAPVVGKMKEYYISVPNFGVGILSIDTVVDFVWIMENLRSKGLPGVDAVTVAAVLADMGDF